MTEIVLLLSLLSTFPRGDSELLRYRLPSVVTSSFELGLGGSSNLYSNDYPRVSTGVDLSPQYHITALGEQLNVDATAQGGLGAIPFSIMPPRYSDVGYHEYSYWAAANLAGSLDWYPTHLPLGLGTDVTAHASANRDEQIPARDTTDLPMSQRESYVLCNLALGPTYGRFRDARTVDQALRIYEILGRDSLLRRATASDDVQFLAELIARKPTFALRYDQPEKNWFQALDSLLRTRQLTPAHLPAREWFLMREVLENVRSISRPVGIRFSARPGFYAYRWRDEIIRPTSVSLDTESLWQRSLTLRLEAGYPLSRRWQLGADASWSLRSPDPWGSAGLDANVALEYEVFDRLLVDLRYEGEYQPTVTWGGDEPVWPAHWHEWYHTIMLAPTYYLEDELTLRAGAYLLLDNYREGTATGPACSRRTAHLSLDVQYRFLPRPFWR